MSAFRLRPIQGIAKHREDEAARRLGAARAHLRTEEAQLERLQAFREEYRAHLRQGLGQGMAATRLAEFQVFLARVEEAIVHQQAAVEAARQALAEARVAWQGRHTRTLSLDKAVERLAAEERRTGERLAQGVADEVAGQRARRVGRVP